jgi:HEPN domain-containing protein
VSFEAFLELAKRDIEAARLLVGKTGHTGQAAAFTQQAAEKMVKAVLAAEGLAVPASHQIGVLIEPLPIDHEWKAEFAAFDRFTPYATKFRYPTPSGKIPPDPSSAAIKMDIEALAALLDDVWDWCRGKSRHSQ